MKYNARDDKGTIPARRRDLLIVKVEDWSDDKPENWSDDKPENCQAYDVEVYVNGEFDPKRSRVFEFGDKSMTKKHAYNIALQHAIDEMTKG